MQFSNPFIVIRDLKVLKQIAVKDFDHFLNHFGGFDETVDPLFGRNLFALKGAFDSNHVPRSLIVIYCA
jgi:cytochrome P450 family 9